MDKKKKRIAYIKEQLCMKVTKEIHSISISKNKRNFTFIMKYCETIFQLFQKLHSHEKKNFNNFVR